MEDSPMEQCDNCLKEYPQSKMATHFGYCRRNIKKCNTCQQMYDINFQQEHDEQYHKQQNCPHCKHSFPSSELNSHQKKCTHKPKYCEYCDLNVPVETFPVHLKECQSRTKPCTKCNRPITNKQYLVHLVCCEGFRQEPKIVQPLPPRTYQEHLQQQRRVIEHTSQTLVDNKSKDKVRQPYEYRGREEKTYAPIINERPEAKVINYHQPGRQQVRNEVRQQIKIGERQEIRQEEDIKQSRKHIVSRGQIRKQQPKKYITTINPPSSITNKYDNNNYKKQDARGIRPNQPQRQPVYQRRQGTGSREPTNGPKDIGSSKNIYTTNSNAPKTRTYGTQDAKKSSDKYGVRQSKPQYQPILQHQPTKTTKQQYQQPRQPIIRKAPEVKTRVIYETRIQQPQVRSNQEQPQIRANQEQGGFMHEEYALGALDLNGQDHQLQMAIMQSMGGTSNKNSSYTFQNEWSNPSFVAQQKAIEEELKKNKQRR